MTNWSQSEFYPIYRGLKMYLMNYHKMSEEERKEIDEMILSLPIVRGMPNGLPEGITMDVLLAHYNLLNRFYKSHRGLCVDIAELLEKNTNGAKCLQEDLCIVEEQYVVEPVRILYRATKYLEEDTSHDIIK